VSRRHGRVEVEEQRVDRGPDRQVRAEPRASSYLRLAADTRWSGATRASGSYRFLRRCGSTRRDFRRRAWPEARKDYPLRNPPVLSRRTTTCRKFQFNTVPPACMKILTRWEAAGKTLGRRGRHVDPHPLLSRSRRHPQHLWRELGFGPDVMHAPWRADAAALEQDEVELVWSGERRQAGTVVVRSLPTNVRWKPS